MADIRKDPKSQIAWGWYNYGLLIGVAHSRRSAVAAVEEHTMQQWKEARKYMEVHKVRVETYRP